MKSVHTVLREADRERLLERWMNLPREEKVQKEMK